MLYLPIGHRRHYTAILQNFGPHIFFWTPHFFVWTPQFGWTLRFFGLVPVHYSDGRYSDS